MSRTPLLLVLGAAALFGTTGTAQALGPDAAPATVGAARVAVGGALLLLYAVLNGELRARPWDMRLVAVSGLAVGIYQVSFFSAVSRTGVAIGTIVALGSAPALTGLLGRLFRGERPGRRWAVATTLATAGSALLVVGGGSIGVDPVGVLLALVAGLGYAVYTLVGKSQLDAGHPPTAVMATAFATGALVLAPVLLLGDTGWLAKPSGLALAAYLGVFTSALAYVLFARGLQALPSATVVTLTLAEPLTATMLGVAVLGERPSLLAFMGAVLVLSGLATLARPRLGVPS